MCQGVTFYLWKLCERETVGEKKYQANEHCFLKRKEEL